MVTGLKVQLLLGSVDVHVQLRARLKTRPVVEEVSREVLHTTPGWGTCGLSRAKAHALVHGNLSGPW